MSNGSANCPNSSSRRRLSKKTMRSRSSVATLLSVLSLVLVSVSGSPAHILCTDSILIVPWNFPIHLMCGKLAPSVLTGNPIIIKPSPFTPYCDLKLGELAQQFFPPGVVQVISGDDNLGPWLTAHPGPDKISFTGSTVTGKKVMESAAKTLKRVTLELYVYVLKCTYKSLTDMEKWWK